MIRNADDADVGRSVRAYRHHAEVARREMEKAVSRLAPMLTVVREGGPQSRAVAGPAVVKIKARVEACRVELRFWLGAVDRILAMHADEHAKRLGWLTPVAHDPTHDPARGITP